MSEEKQHEVIPILIDKSWHKVLQPLFNDPKMAKLKHEILPMTKFYPDPKDIFRAFRMPLDKIKVAIIGQDPYPNGEAIGLAFAVSRHKYIPKSLEIIRQEIIRSGVERDSLANIDLDIWRELVHWKNQGVFLLNSALTVEAKNSGSHTGYWQWFTREVVHHVSKQVAPVWLLWGGDAKGFKSYIENPIVVNKPEDLKEDSTGINYILEAYHPAAETYPNANPAYKFTGCNHFKKCNYILKHKGQTIINW
jgi:uracil-DNA glycosylase